jgi:GxxExxY protein
MCLALTRVDYAPTFAFHFLIFKIIIKIMQNLTQKKVQDLSYLINSALIEVHKNLGPGLLESVYHKCLEHEFRLHGLKFQSHFSTPISYKGIHLQSELRCDFLVENTIVVEIKSVEKLLPVFEAQLITYMHLLQCPKGILVNFNSLTLMSEGHKSLVNQLFSALPS